MESSVFFSLTLTGWTKQKGSKNKVSSLVFQISHNYELCPKRLRLTTKERRLGMHAAYMSYGLHLCMVFGSIQMCSMYMQRKQFNNDIDLILVPFIGINSNPINSEISILIYFLGVLLLAPSKRWSELVQSHQRYKDYKVRLIG
jgi:hypothetical protein